MNKSIFTELEHYGEILEKHFHDMMDVEFTVENGITEGTVRSLA